MARPLKELRDAELAALTRLGDAVGLLVDSLADPLSDLAELAQSESASRELDEAMKEVRRGEG